MVLLMTSAGDVGAEAAEGEDAGGEKHKDGVDERGERRTPETS